MRVVVGVDGSKSSTEAAHWAAGYAALTQSELEVVSAWHWPSMYGAGGAPAIDFEGETRTVVAEVVAELRTQFPDLKISDAIVAGPSAQALIDASVGADLLVVGSRGHGAFAGMLIGSVSLHCVHHATCPVVVVRT